MHLLWAFAWARQYLCRFWAHEHNDYIRLRVVTTQDSICYSEGECVAAVTSSERDPARSPSRDLRWRVRCASPTRAVRATPRRCGPVCEASREV
jgi:hypothetical protein